MLLPILELESDPTSVCLVTCSQTLLCVILLYYGVLLC
jgi:hypothetical protein